MNPLHTDLPIIYLKPGEVHFSDNPELVATILGSCISVIMYNRKFHLTAVSHSLLPKSRGNSANENPYRFVDSSFREMFQWFQRHGIKAQQLQVKVFGGAEVLQAITPTNAAREKSIGTLNIERILELILQYRLTISAIDVGGDSGRKLFIYTENGDVLLKRIKKSSIDSACFKLEQLVKS